MFAVGTAEALNALGFDATRSGQRCDRFRWPEPANARGTVRERATEVASPS